MRAVYYMQCMTSYYKLVIAWASLVPHAVIGTRAHAITNTYIVDAEESLQVVPESLSVACVENPAYIRFCREGQAQSHQAPHMHPGSSYMSTVYV